jgi:diadenosine tetraphosphate (Ap4A) HIT family hydrolase
MNFALNAQLARDTTPVGDLALCRALLMNDRRFPWLILVPRLPEVRDMHDLDDAGQIALMREINTTAQRMAWHFKADKMNVAALGNVVPQLHIHVIARHAGDAAWPSPVWGRLPVEPYPPGLLSVRIRDLQTLFSTPPLNLVPAREPAHE